MQFRQGMLGVAVVAVALATAILGSWVMSLDIEEKQVTRFNELTEITTLFDSDLVPTFTDYNPSDNYVGYFTDATTIDGVRYFGGVDYGEAVRANNFKVNLPPVGKAEGIDDLTGDTVDIDDAIIYFYEPNSTSRTFSKRVNVDAIGALDICRILAIQPKGTLSLSSTVPLSNDWYNTLSTDAIIFGSVEDINKQVFRNVEYQAFDGKASVLSYEYTHTATSARIDFDTGAVILYADANFTEQLRIISIGDFMILYSGGRVSLGTTIGYSYVDFGPPSYLDPSKGVELE